MTTLPETIILPRPVAEGLILRRASTADTEAVAALNGRILADENESPEWFAAWTRDLMSGRHPTNTATDFVVAEDIQTGQLVSSACLIPQIWRYEDIPFGVGRPELVVTDPAYRRRGLVRSIFETLHALSAAQGHLAQGITGIPWFYRQFGYEYALPLGGSRNLNLTDVPSLEGDAAEPFQVRPASPADIPVLMNLYQRRCTGNLVTTQIDAERWRYDLNGHSPESVQKLHVNCLLDQAGHVIGYFTISALPWGGHLTLWELEVAEGISLRAALPVVTRALKAQAEAYQSNIGSQPKPLTGLRFALGLENPAYEAFEAKLGPFQPPYAWYVRVPDLPGFIRHITPVLEKRLAASVMAGFSGELKITFYRHGLCLTFTAGRLTEVAAWPPPESNQQWDGAGFSGLTFLQLLFGYRSLAELRYAFPDCWADEEPTLLLNALFPKQSSLVFPLG